MTLEQRVEALEKQMALLSDGRFSLKDEEVFLNDTLIQNGEKATQRQVADNYDTLLHEKRELIISLLPSLEY